MSTEQEIKEIARIIAGMERVSEENDPAFDKHLETVKEIFEDFNKKYPRVTLKLESRIDAIIVRILINEREVKKVFEDVASKLKALTGIGLKAFEEATIQEGEKFASLAQKITNSVLLTYSLDIGTETVVLQYNPKEEKVELNFEVKSLANPQTPQHQLIQEYCKKQAGEDINILNKCYTLGFIDIEDAALFDWEDEFYPKMLE